MIQVENLLNKLYNIAEENQHKIEEFLEKEEELLKYSPFLASVYYVDSMFTIFTNYNVVWIASPLVALAALLGENSLFAENVYRILRDKKVRDVVLSTILPVYLLKKTECIICKYLPHIGATDFILSKGYLYYYYAYLIHVRYLYNNLSLFIRNTTHLDNRLETSNDICIHEKEFCKHLYMLYAQNILLTRGGEK